MSNKFASELTLVYLQGVNINRFVRAILKHCALVYQIDPLRAYKIFDDAYAEFGMADVNHCDCFLQVKNFLFKRSDILCNDAALLKAISDFDAVEAHCASLKFDYWDIDIIRIREIISRILGIYDDRSLSEILDRSRPGSGQSIGIWNRFRTSSVHKLVACDYTITPKALLPGMKLIGYLSDEWIIGDRKPRPVAGSKLSFVPKNIRTFRTIATEPNVNMMLQLGVHEYIVPRLLRNGINLRDQSINQNLARHASIFDDFATIDFSAASDTLSDSLVYAILPRQWYLFLNSIRCSVYCIDDIQHRQSKFSTMGNGFTFALESLIFYAIARHICGPDSTISVFGDDVIIPSRHYDRFVALTKKLGLILNKDKSYSIGPFRESCGTDWWRGMCVTPLRLQDEEVTEQTCYRFINNWGLRPGGKDVREYIISYLKKHDITPLYGLANELDDSCIFTTFAYAQGGGWLTYRRKHQSYTFRGLVTKGVRDTVYDDDWRYLAAKLYGASESEVNYQLRGCNYTVYRNLTAGLHLRTHTYRTHGLSRS